MGKLSQGIRAELIKMRRTWILGLHIVMPLAGILIFLLYYRFSSWEAWGKISGYVEVLTIVCPTLVAVICALAAGQEKQAGHLQNLLGVTKTRAGSFGRKWGVLLLANLAALFLAVVGFGVGFRVFVSPLVPPFGFYLILTLIMWIPQIIAYGFHLFLGLRFSKGVTIGVGIIESLLAGLLMTGLGDGLWQLFPCAWAGHFTGYYLLFIQHTEGLGQIVQDARLGGICMAVITLLGAMVLFVWIGRYEGHTLED